MAFIGSRPRAAAVDDRRHPRGETHGLGGDADLGQRAQVRVKVDEAGDDKAPFSVEDRRRVRANIPD